MNKARGMPDMALRPDTEEYLKEQEDQQNAEAKKVEEQEIFQKPNVEVKIEEKLEVKEKVKKKLTEKQLEALKRGREKSIAIRKAKAEDKKKAKIINAPKNHVEQQIPSRSENPTTPHYGGAIDYDKIINGVSNIFDARQRKQQEVEVNVKEFEKRVRFEERNTVLQELEKIQKEEEIAKNVKQAGAILNRPPQSQNPYAYALNMGARSRYSRY